ncbi:hypothetical protein E2562_028004 [Oryza meyeriana var. granulata]|uniref:Uncharacterized protein n=1 Tax=Oryza meyeriana var. granulata TaxID=110450 RepID=A0A6G1CTX3_9ORYZ|nr:hypothetical protein E2562_028004 [Oryza meyeriana var. granulata]
MRPENHALQAAMISIAPVLQLCLGDLIRYLPYPYQKKGTQVKDVWANTTYKSKMVHPLTHNSGVTTYQEAQENYTLLDNSYIQETGKAAKGTYWSCT